MMKKLLTCLCVALAMASGSSASTRIVASSTDLAAIAGEITGNLADIQSIASGKSNLHFVEVLPSHMLKVSKADLYLKIGLEQDIWADGIIDGSRNGKLVVIDCSKGIEVLEKPTGKVDASMGDIHPAGNPHYWLDPRNGRIIADNILEGLSRVDAANLSIYRERHAQFVAELEAKWQGWSARLADLKGVKVISYHNTWPYLANAFGVTVAGFIEPKPGIEPTASHTSELIDLTKAEGITAILREPYFSERAPQAIAKATGAAVLTAPSSVGGTEGADTYFTLFDTLLDILLQARNGN